MTPRNYWGRSDKAVPRSLRPRGPLPKPTCLCDYCGERKPAVGNALMTSGHAGAQLKMACNGCRKFNLENGLAVMAPDS